MPVWWWAIPNGEVGRALLAVDVTEEVLAEAEREAATSS